VGTAGILESRGYRFGVENANRHTGEQNRLNSKMPACSLIIVSYGSAWWKQAGDERALPSARAQGDYEIIRIHRDDPNTNLCSLRNQAVVQATSDHVVVLDADDELEPGYVDAMLAASGDIRYPKIRVLSEPNETPLPAPYEIDARPIWEGNYVIVGAMMRRDMFLNLGGYDPELEYAEDWDFYIRAFFAGASFQFVAHATYRQNWRLNSRNQNPDGERLRQQIRDRYSKLAKEAGLI
jgi:glycosyltransferase involved in cell wall biosynthesis